MTEYLLRDDINHVCPGKKSFMSVGGKFVQKSYVLFTSKISEILLQEDAEFTIGFSSFAYGLFVHDFDRVGARQFVYEFRVPISSE